MGIVGAKYVAILRGLVAIFMFGVQTFFLSKSIGYLIRMSFFSIDSTFLDKEIFTLFFYGLNIIDWFSFLIVVLETERPVFLYLLLGFFDEKYA